MIVEPCFLCDHFRVGIYTLNGEDPPAPQPRQRTMAGPKRPLPRKSATPATTKSAEVDGLLTHRGTSCPPRTDPKKTRSPESSPGLRHRTEGMTLLVAIVAWALVTFGLTYLVTRAEITEPDPHSRRRLRALTALLLSCRSCSLVLDRQAAAAATMGIACGLGCTPTVARVLYLRRPQALRHRTHRHHRVPARHYGGGMPGHKDGRNRSP